MNRRDWLKLGIAGAGGAALYKGLETWRLLPALGKVGLMTGVRALPARSDIPPEQASTTEQVPFST